MPTMRDNSRWRTAWMLLAMFGVAGVIYWLVRPVAPREALAGSRSDSRAIPEAVRAERDGTIAIAADSPIHKHLSQLEIVREHVAFPVLTVSGSILARISSGDTPLEDRWQFSSGELAGKYADWVRTTGEIEFAKNQLSKTKQLGAAQTGYLADVVKHMEPSVKLGSIPEKTYKAAQAELMKAQLQGEKDVFSAESVLRVANKTRTALERDLSQGGLEPVVFSRAVEHMVLIAANVPEGKISQVREGQGCVVRFYAFPDQAFDAHVETLNSLLHSERRTMRVLFELNDPREILRPGMFAEVGLGTDDRESILIPAEALLHIDRHDYVVVATAPERYKPARVRVGEQHGEKFEVLQGLNSGEMIVTRGAILLKPAVMQVLSRAALGKQP